MPSPPLHGSKKETRLRRRTGTLGCVKYGPSVREPRLAPVRTQEDHVARYLAHRRDSTWTLIPARALLFRHKHYSQTTCTGLALPRHLRSSPRAGSQAQIILPPREPYLARTTGGVKAFLGQRVPCGRERTASPESYSARRRPSNGPCHRRGGAAPRLGRLRPALRGPAGPLPTGSRRRHTPPFLAPTYEVAPALRPRGRRGRAWACVRVDAPRP